ncbi:MAG: NADPH:quinone reductase [Firmicutes bacterium]|nr:NADPH:quinone reductase [Alicyclobacillaceae bacterium]MCL6497429.1 NADPH:quinone reductase [Bacillota bacterium]
MHAMLVTQPGGPEVFAWEEVPLDPPGPGEVQVQILAVGVNPVDRRVRRGEYPAARLPFIPGNDAAGVVTAVGSGVERIRVGDRVYVSASHIGRGGATYAEATNVLEAACWPLPDGFSFAEGAALGLPYTTGYRALALSQARPGDTILVRGASGGVGTAVLQWARVLGIATVGTASTEAGRQHVLAQGARAALDHRDREGLKALAGSGFAAVIDVAATEHLTDDVALTAPGGHVVMVSVSTPATVPIRDIQGKGITLVGVSGRTWRPGEQEQIHRRLQPWLFAGAIRPVIWRRFPLQEAGAAQEVQAEGGAVGKVVLIPPAGETA